MIRRQLRIAAGVVSILTLPALYVSWYRRLLPASEWILLLGLLSSILILAVMVKLLIKEPRNKLDWALFFVLGVLVLLEGGVLLAGCWQAGLGGDQCLS
jgi:predicted membrane channel-forming protein YqfA (hemolysin III family)